MRNFEVAKMNMYGVVEECLRVNESIWQPIQHINDSVVAFRNCHAKVKSYVVTRNGKITRFAEEKKARRIVLEQITLFVALQIKAFARMTDNDSLFTDMHYTKTSLRLSRGKDLVFDAGKIHEVATTHAIALAALGVTEAVREDLLTKLRSFSDYLNTPAEEHKLDKEKTANFRKTIKEMDDLLKNRLDLHLRYFETIEKGFFTVYFINRRINDLPTIKLAMRCKIMDATTKEPLQALVKITDHNIHRKASPKGQLLVRNLKEGNHTVNVSLGGYIVQSPQVAYVKGKTTFLTVELLKEE